MAVPNELAHVQDLKNREPQEWADAHTGNPRTENFVRHLAVELHAKDPKWGLMGKRGNPDDIADDVLCYRGEGVGHDPTDSNKPITGIDFISGAGGTNPQPAWQVYNDPNNPDHTGPGAWVKPSAAAPGPTPVPVPVPIPVVPGREEALDEINFLDGYYKAPEGLQRPNGLSLNGRPDFLGIAAWYLDEYQKARVAGKSRADARAIYVKQIRNSDEWRQKHPGETP